LRSGQRTTQTCGTHAPARCVGFPSSPPRLPAHDQLVSSSFNAAPKCASPHCEVAAASNAAESRARRRRSAAGVGECRRGLPMDAGGHGSQRRVCRQPEVRAVRLDLPHLRQDSLSPQTALSEPNAHSRLTLNRRLRCAMRSIRASRTRFGKFTSFATRGELRVCRTTRTAPAARVTLTAPVSIKGAV
jgi:hypothetical protein